MEDDNKLGEDNPATNDKKLDEDKKLEEASRAVREEAKIDKNPRGNKRKRVGGSRRSGVIVFCLGILVLIGGLVFMIFQLTAKPAVRDAEYLVKVGAWEREDAPGVIWNFTEVGKGRLTTNSHQNDYDFLWAISGDKLEIETDWLYTLDNSYTYVLDQENNLLILDDKVKFRPASSVDAEITEDN